MEEARCAVNVGIKWANSNIYSLATKREAQSFGGVREDDKQIGMSPKIADVVFLRTGIGGMRVLDMLVGDPLPRIC